MFMQNLEKRMFKKTPAGYIFQFPPSRFRRTDAVLGPVFSYGVLLTGTDQNQTRNAVL